MAQAEFPRSSFPNLLFTGTKETKGTKRTMRTQPKYEQDEQDDAQLLRVSFQPASFKDVIPALQGSVPEEYLLPEINRHKVGNPDFQVDKLDKVSNRVKTFINKMRIVVENEKDTTGTDSNIDTLVDDLLRIADLNCWPLKILNHPLRRIIIKGKPFASADLDFVVTNQNLNMVVIEDKHIKNVYSSNGFGETLIAANIIACGDEDIHHGLPKSEVIIKRWPEENAKRKGLDLVEPDGRRKVLEALANIRQFLLRHEKPVSDLYMTPITRVPNSPNWWV
ncbi:unnamed protein product [Rhizophagus irregularis]|uniref:Uncharacterized protein n=1 Tax=Rhizophagus irregularis TaxID=588596 RepID=A0A2N1N080_9GLOM|nr:hypothetical protein RhiirC2_783683 [Rhizophagus irregularis]CAB5394785.1 unnamed protein product [Rhizophagus irregularis]